MINHGIGSTMCVENVTLIKSATLEKLKGAS